MTDSTARTPAADDSGRFPIEGARTMLPPANENKGDVLSLEDLGGSVVESKPRTAPPPPPRAAAPNSGVFTKSAHNPDAELADFAEKLISLSPIYGPSQTAPAERAVLEVEDLSLRPDNPYLASSLVPPSEPVKTSRARLWAAPVVVAALVAGGWAGWSAQTTTPTGPTAQPAPRAARNAAPMSAPTAVPAAPIAAPAAETETAVLAATEQAPTTAAADTSERVASVAVENAPVIHAAPSTPKPRSGATSAPAAAATHTPAPAVSTASVAPATSNEELPLTPSREQVSAGFEGVRAQLAQCAAGQQGVAQLAVTIANTGRISHALIEGKFAGTPEGSCMARAVRSARFPRFAQATLKVSYPVAF